MAGRTKRVATATRMLAFAKYLKSYMGAWSILSAAVPIPLAAAKAIPAFDSLRLSMATYSGLMCFLIVGFVFYSRHSIASILFLHRHSRMKLARFIGFAPLLCIVCCALCIYEYHSFFNEAIATLKANTPHPSFGLTSTPPEDDGQSAWSTATLVKVTPSDLVPDGPSLIVLYIAIFACAEFAFALMAVREYIQDDLGRTDQSVVAQIAVPPAEKKGT